MPVDRVKLVTALYSNLEKWYKIFIKSGLPPVLKAWKDYFMKEGKPITVKGLTRNHKRHLPRGGRRRSASSETTLGRGREGRFRGRRVILAIDIGNTNIVAGVFDGKNLLAHWRMETAKERTSDEYGITLLSLFAHAGIKKEEIEGACVGCVVPQLKDTFTRMIRDYVKVAPL